MLPYVMKSDGGSAGIFENTLNLIVNLGLMSRYKTTMATTRNEAVIALCYHNILTLSASLVYSKIYPLTDVLILCEGYPISSPINMFEEFR